MPLNSRQLQEALSRDPTFAAVARCYEALSEVWRLRLVYEEALRTGADGPARVAATRGGVHVSTVYRSLGRTQHACPPRAGGARS